MSPTQKIKRWWNQFPPALRAIAKARLLGAMGAGGVIYLTPLVFNQINLSATEIGSGIAAAALAGTFARLMAGTLIDKGLNSLYILRGYAMTAICADFLLINADNYIFYLLGEILIGIGAGLYWPSIELAVANGCGNFPSSKGFALVRSSDALGTSIGALLGAIGAALGLIKIIYVINTICMLCLIRVLNKKHLINQYSEKFNSAKTTTNKNVNHIKHLSWLRSIMAILLISFLATGIFSLLQSILPLDLVKGGIYRPSISEGWSGGLIAWQLGLLVLLQWPIGRWLSNYNPQFGLRLSISNFGFGCFLLGLSSFSLQGITLAVIAQVPMAIGLAAFLPTATEAIIQIAPLENRGLAMAIFSQCFALSALTMPIIAGQILDVHGHGMYIWLIMSLGCFFSLPIIKPVKSNKESIIN